MAGGKGTRLRPYTAVLPKPLVPVGDMSIIEMVLRQLKLYGFDSVKISVGHKAQLVMALVGDGSRFGLKVSYHQEEKPLGTVGALAEMQGLEESFLVMNGDVCTNLNFAELLKAHVASGALATIGTYQRKEKIELGVLDADPSGKTIVGFREKPVFDFLVSMGVNAFNRKIIDLIPRGEFFGFDSLMLKMLEKKVAIRSHLFTGIWSDIGRPDDYDKFCEDFEKNAKVYLPEP
jgi:NDP-sugar pyrophosphorylase family protein